MSNQGYEAPPGPPPGHQGLSQDSDNPWASQPSSNRQYQAPPRHGGGYAQQPPPPGNLPARTDSFKESDFVPQDERGEQRESMQQFEMSNSQPASETDRNVATLQQEFPNIDGALIAALYGDSQSLGATRETLQELASQN